METATSSPNTYELTGILFRLWTKAEALYRSGNRSPEEYFDDSESNLLSSHGLGPMDVYDYVEDFVTSREPDFATFALITAERVFYFFDEMGGRLSGRRIRMDDLPPKDAAVDGVEWLPRILPKARAKLRGELPPDLMYGCGGDRRFLKARGIHPAEFLRKVRSAHDDRVVIDWVVARG